MQGQSIHFVCNGCMSRSINFKGSSLVESSQRTVVGLNQCLGIPALSKYRFYEVIKLMYPHIHDILSEMYNAAKEQVKNIDNSNLGSWQRAVVTSDGVWHTCGHFSKNGSFIIKNYLTGGLMWFGHKCMNGNAEDDLFLRTSKSMECSC